MKEFQDKTKKEIEKMLKDKREALRAFKFGISGSKVKNIKEGAVLKKDIARILTFINSGVTLK
jgi:ribosomal protein L29